MAFAQAPAFDVVRTFTGAGDGGMPVGLIQASDGYFYGVTANGGALGNGTVFKMDASGTLTTLHAFNFSDGYRCENLIQASAGGGQAASGRDSPCSQITA